MRSLGAILDGFTTELSRLTILSMPRGPSDVLTTSATAKAIKRGQLTVRRAKERGDALTLGCDDVGGADVLRLFGFD